MSTKSKKPQITTKPSPVVKTPQKQVIDPTEPLIKLVRDLKKEELKKELEKMQLTTEQRDSLLFFALLEVVPDLELVSTIIEIKVSNKNKK